MLGTGLQIGRGGRGEDRFYNPAKARRAHQNHRAEQLRRAQSDVSPSQPQSSSSSSFAATAATKENQPANRTGFREPAAASRLSNLERFLQSITPSVPAQYLSKVFSSFRLFV